jgi:D-serine dehydratase
MAPDLAHALVEAGAWGTTVADIRQAAVMLRAGLKRLILANEVGGIGGARRLAALVTKFPDAELYAFVDSIAAANALASAWQENPGLPSVSILIETGAGRAGARSTSEAEAVADAVQAAGGRLRLAGVATYEGAAAVADPVRTDEIIGSLLAMTGDLILRLRARLGPDAPLILTAGGSTFFDKVVAQLLPFAREAKAPLLLRSGAIYFHDHGLYDRALAALDQRNGFVVGGAGVSAQAAFRPALRLWAEVLSRPEPGLAICGMGMRDVSFDQGFAKVLAIHRNGERLPATAKAPEVFKLNDQHAFLSVAPEDGIAVGDVVEFGISHPCTCLDRYRVIFGTDRDGYVQHAFPTYFG